MEDTSYEDCMEFYNDMIYYQEAFYESHKRVIEKIAIELNAGDKIDYLVDRYLGKPLKFKKRKDPNLPKKALSNYLFFCREKRPEIIEENPGCSIAKISKILGSMWSELSDDEKQKFNILHSKDKERYNLEWETYMEKKGLPY